MVETTVLMKGGSLTADARSARVQLVKTHLEQKGSWKRTQRFYVGANSTSFAVRWPNLNNSNAHNSKETTVHFRFVGVTLSLRNFIVATLCETDPTTAIPYDGYCGSDKIQLTRPDRILKIQHISRIPPVFGRATASLQHRKRRYVTAVRALQTTPPRPRRALATPLLIIETCFTMMTPLKRARSARRRTGGAITYRFISDKSDGACSWCVRCKARPRTPINPWRPAPETRPVFAGTHAPVEDAKCPVPLAPRSSVINYLRQLPPELGWQTWGASVNTSARRRTAKACFGEGRSFRSHAYTQHSTHKRKDGAGVLVDR